MNIRVISALAAKDLKLYFSDRLFAVVTVLGLVGYIVVYFLLPATVDETLGLGLYAPDMPPALEQLLSQADVDFLRASSLEALRQAVLDGTVPAGFGLPDDLMARLERDTEITVQLYISPDVPQEFVEIYEVILHEFAFAFSGQPLMIETTEIVLGPDMAGAPISPRERMLPLLTVFVLMVECLGLASLISAEIETGTLQALLITRLTMVGLFVGKGLFGTLFAFAQVVLLMAITGGLFHQPALILTALLLGAALVTGVAFLIASTGRDLMSVMGWGILAVLLLVLPTLAILVPGLASNWIRAIPSYYLTDTIYRVITFGVTWGDVASNLLILFTFAAMFLALGVVVLKRKFQ